MKKVGQIKQYIFVICELTSREIRRKYVRSSLGIIWSILNPLMYMIVVSMIFSYMFRHSIENYPIYYLTGNIIWGLFSQATNTSIAVLVDNKNLLIRTKLPKQVFVLSRVYTAFVNFGYTCIAYVLMLIFFGVKPSLAALIFLPDILVILIFSIGVSYALSSIYVLFADIKYLYSILLTLLMYLSALFYPADQLPAIMQRIIEFNPIYIAVFIARKAVMEGTAAEYNLWLRLLLWTISMLVLGVYVFKRNENLIVNKNSI